MEIEEHNILIKNGNLYLDFQVYNTYFKNIESVVLLNKPPCILIMPVQQKGAGGLLLKIKNSKGDRVVNIMEFLEIHRISLPIETLPVYWSTSDAALVVKC